KLIGDLDTQPVTGFSERDVLVVTFLRLRRGREDRRIEATRLDESPAERLTRQRARRPILLPRRTRDVTADDAFDGEGLQLADEHRTAFPDRLVRREDGVSFRDDGRVYGDDVVGNQVGGSREPPGRDQGEDLSLSGDRLRKD